MSDLLATNQQAEATHKQIEATFQQWQAAQSTHLAEKNQQVANMQRMEILRKLEQTQRTLFVQNQPVEILENSKALAGKLSKLSKPERDLHAKQQKETVKQLESLLN